METYRHFFLRQEVFLLIEEHVHLGSVALEDLQEHDTNVAYCSTYGPLLSFHETS